MWSLYASSFHQVPAYGQSREIIIIVPLRDRYKRGSDAFLFALVEILKKAKFLSIGSATQLLDTDRC